MVLLLRGNTIDPWFIWGAGLGTVARICFGNGESIETRHSPSGWGFCTLPRVPSAARREYGVGRSFVRNAMVGAECLSASRFARIGALGIRRCLGTLGTRSILCRMRAVTVEFVDEVPNAEELAPTCKADQASTCIDAECGGKSFVGYLPGPSKRAPTRRHPGASI